MERRKFLTRLAATTSLVGIGGVGLTSCSFQDPRRKLTILHTNDVHSHIDPFPQNDPFYANLGGVSRRATLIDAIRKENPDTLLFDAGDIFQGTPYFNFYGGELEFKLMSALKYDASTIGNHDFDNGLDGLLAQLPYAKFRFVISNYDFTNTIMEGQTIPYQVYNKAGVKIGVYGLGIELKGLVSDALYGETRYLDPFELALDMERVLKESEHCDLVVCLSHLGYQYKNEQKPDDMKLAARTRYTDLIIGGHTHTFLKQASVVENADGKRVLVNQVGCFGVNLGRVDFYFDANGPVASEGISIQV